MSDKRLPIRTLWYVLAEIRKQGRPKKSMTVQIEIVMKIRQQDDLILISDLYEI